jgi:hypothetical protein
MKDSKPITYMKSFSIDEIKNLEKFLNSPYFGCKPVVVALFNTIKKFYPGFTNENIYRKTIFKVLYPGKKYNDVLMRKLISELGRYIEEFIAVERVLSAKNNRTAAYMEAAIERKFDIQFDKVTARAENEILGRNLIYNDFLKDSAALYRIKFNHSNTFNDYKNSIDSLQLYGDYLVSYFIQTMTDIYKSKAQMISSYNPKNSSGVFDSFYKNFSFENFIKESGVSPVLKDYNFLLENYLIYRIHSDIDDFDSYNSLKTLVTSNIKKYNFDYGTRVINSLLNFGLSRIIHKKDSSYYPELLILYKLALEHGNLLSFHNKFMNLVTYRNILYIASAQGEYKWVKMFIEDFLPKVNDDNRETLKHFSYAILYFERKDYNNSLEELSKIKFDHAIFKLDTKNLLLKNYYELGYTESAYSAIDAYSHLLSGNINLSTAVKKMHSDFITYYRKLLKLADKPDEFTLDKLQKQVIADEGVISRDWLLEKIKAL